MAAKTEKTSKRLSRKHEKETKIVKGVKLPELRRSEIRGQTTLRRAQGFQQMAAPYHARVVLIKEVQVVRIVEFAKRRKKNCDGY
jgi:hypothetical protein